jgi:hypothetical protein
MAHGSRGSATFMPPKEKSDIAVTEA